MVSHSGFNLLQLAQFLTFGRMNGCERGGEAVYGAITSVIEIDDVGAAAQARDPFVRSSRWRRFGRIRRRTAVRDTRGARGPGAAISREVRCSSRPDARQSPLADASGDAKRVRGRRQRALDRRRRRGLRRRVAIDFVQHRARDRSGATASSDGIGCRRGSTSPKSRAAVTSLSMMRSPAATARTRSMTSLRPAARRDRRPHERSAPADARISVPSASAVGIAHVCIRFRTPAPG